MMNDFREYSAAFHYHNGEIMHFGILGMKWGVRRYQNKDGSLTAAGKKRYSDEELNEIKKASERGGIIGGFMAKRKIDKRKKQAAANDIKEREKYAPSEEDANKLKEKRNSFETDEAKDKWEADVDKAYEKRYDALHKLFTDEKKFAKVIDKYYDSHPDKQKYMTKEQYRNWCLYDDGWQDTEDDWYIENYHKDIDDEITKLYKHRQ
jgi:hypothetical protein